MEPASPVHIDAPQAVAIGMTVTSIQGGVATAQLPWRADLVGDPASGVLAGGAVTTLLDHVCGSSVFSALEAAGRRDSIGSIATLDLRIDYMRPATTGRTLVAKAHCYRVTKSIAFVRASAFHEEDNPVATVQAAFAINPKPAP